MTAADWQASNSPIDLLTCLYQPDSSWFASRKVRLFAVACCRLCWDDLALASKLCAQFAERFADGLATELEREQHWRSGVVVPATNEQQFFKDDLGWLACTNGKTTTLDAFFTLTHPEDLDEPAAHALRDIFPWPGASPVTIAPAHLTPDVVALAHAAYDERLPDGSLDNVRLAILADCLEEAGLEECPLLWHLRNQVAVWDDALSGWRLVTAPNKHFRGMWSLDCILGKR